MNLMCEAQSMIVEDGKCSAQLENINAAVNHAMKTVGLANLTRRGTERGDPTVS